MKIALGLIVIVVAANARATPYVPSNDPWYYDPTNHLSSGAYATARSILPTFNSSTGLFDIAYDGLFGTSQIVLNAPGTYLNAQSLIGKSTGYASATQVPLPLHQYWHGNGKFATGWRDVWTVSGLNDPTWLRISGHTSGHMEGWAYLHSGVAVQTIQSNGGGHSAVASFTMTTNGGYSGPHCYSCVVEFDYMDGMSIANFTLSVLVNNGDKVRIDAHLLGDVSSVYSPGGLIDGLHTSSIDLIFGDQPLSLTSDSGKLISTHDGFQYDFDVSAVPEPSSSLMWLIGLLCMLMTRPKCRPR